MRVSENLRIVVKCTLFVHLPGKIPYSSVHFTQLLISEGGKCTLGVHLSWEYYIVFIYVVLYQLECSIYIFVC